MNDRTTVLIAATVSECMQEISDYVIASDQTPLTFMIYLEYNKRGLYK